MIEMRRYEADLQFAQPDQIIDSEEQANRIGSAGDSRDDRPARRRELETPPFGYELSNKTVHIESLDLQSRKYELMGSLFGPIRSPLLDEHRQTRCADQLTAIICNIDLPDAHRASGMQRFCLDRNYAAADGT